jgi:hypothetical protein
MSHFVRHGCFPPGMHFELKLFIMIEYVSCLVIILYRSISVSVRSKMWVCGHLHAGIVGLNPTGGMAVFLL